MRVARWVLGAIGMGLVTLALAGRIFAQEEEDNAWTGGRCNNPRSERVFVCEVGDPKPLSMRSFLAVLETDEAVRAVVRRIGLPDRVELQQVRVEAPWAAYELRTYYRQYDRMYAFARAFALDEPQISVLRYQGPIPDDKWAEMTQVTQIMHSDAADRAERDAERAERAAAEAEAKADRASSRADQAEAISDKAGADFRSSLVKH